jgi:glycerol-3-phosphate dehydrogenase
MTPSYFDLIIIGAGINGAGIARDAAMRGLNVLVLDKGDIGSGTSSYSTRLIHGGLRYLEYGEFGLVRESLRERETLLRIAPHLVKPIPILIPIYEGASRGRLTIRAGMLAYDLLSLGKSVPSHQILSREQTLQNSPGLAERSLVGGAVYYDCQVEFAERLVLENILSATQHGAKILTYAHVKRITDRQVDFVLHGRQETVSGGVVINAAGPWVDEVLKESGTRNERLIGGTKGSHIVVKAFTGAPSQAVYVEAETDRRPFFVIPWNGNYLIGTTDDRFAGDIDQVRSESWEVDYLLKETNRVFPQADLRRADIRYTYSGVRPSPFTEQTQAQSITRRHFIREHQTNKNLLSIVGGKLTTYRSLAEECVDIVFHKLGKQSRRCQTQEIGLPGASSVEPDWPRKSSDKVRNRLSRIYGSRSSELVDLCNAQPGLSETFNKGEDALAAEIVFAFESEMATTLTDCLMRRTMIGLNADLGTGDIQAATEICKRHLAWSDDRVRIEVEAYKKHVALMLISSSADH